MTMRSISVVVTIEIDDCVTISHVKEYVNDAVGSWNGQFHPEDIFHSQQGFESRITAAWINHPAKQFEDD